MKRIILFAAVTLLAGGASAQMTYEEFAKQQNQQYQQFKSDRQAEFDAFRKRVNEEYADFMKKRWELYNAMPAVEPTQEKDVAPVEFKEEPQPEQNAEAPKTEEKQQTVADNKPAEKPQPVADNKPAEKPQPVADEKPAEKPQPAVADNKPAEEPKPAEAAPEEKPDERQQGPVDRVKTPVSTFTPKPIPIQKDIVIVPKPEPAPEPIAPVEPDKEKPHKTEAISFYGTMVSVGFPEPDPFRVPELKEAALAEAWKQLSNERYDITVNNVLTARESLKLCDWGYMNFLKEITEKHYGQSNEAVYMMAYLMTQSGYRVRLAFSTKKNKLYMLFACKYDIYSMTYYKVDGQKFYAFNCDAKDLNICPAAVDKEKSLSLQIATDQQFDKNLTQKRTLTSKKGVTATVCVNKNNIDFFNTYPSAFIGGDQTTRWAAYANTPLEKNVREALYPQLKEKLRGLSEKDAVGLILNWIQTAFVYEYDDKVWGHDRAFFAAETLFYPYCDCEDRAILFSRLVRDLIGSDVVLLYYPGHLAAAVGFKEQVNGDYLFYNNKKYVVCDPTYINAGVGRTMPGMDNQKAKVIVL